MPSGKESERCPLGGILHNPPCIRSAAAGIEAFDEMRPDAPQEKVDARHRRDLPLDDKLVVVRQHRRQQDAIEVAGMIGHNDSGVAGHVLEPADARSSKRQTEHGSRALAGDEPAAFLARSDYQKPCCYDGRGAEHADKPDSVDNVPHAAKWIHKLLQSVN